MLPSRTPVRLLFTKFHWQCGGQGIDDCSHQPCPLRMLCLGELFALHTNPSCRLSPLWPPAFSFSEQAVRTSGG